MRSRSISFALVVALAGLLTYLSISAVNAAPQPPVGGAPASRPVASCGLLSFARHDYRVQFPFTVGAVDDINGDGKPDLVGTDYYRHNVVLLLNNGSGGYSTPITYSVGNYPPIDVAIADFNGDGKLDLAVLIIDSDTDQHNAVMLFLGHGDGTFQPGNVIALTPYPGGIAVSDFNRDGKPDLVINNGYDAHLWVLLGNGDGTFQPTRVVWVGDIPGKPVIGDFNADGNPDIVVPNESSNSVAILLGRGDGSFQTASFFPVGPFPVFAIAGDFNGDGKLDLAVANGVDAPHARIMLLPGDGSGRFSPAIVYYPGYYSGPLAASDLDHDGHADLALINGLDSKITVWRGSNAGFNPPVGYSIDPGYGPILVADLNGDGRPDLITTTGSAGDIIELINTCAPSTVTPPTSTPSATPPPTFTPSPTYPPCAVPFTDINGNSFYKAIQYLYCYRIVNGYGNTYLPGDSADRAQFAKVAMIGFGLYSYGEPGQPYFTDVPVSHYAFKYVSIGYQAGILNGFDAATCAVAGAAYPCYLPERAVTRGQLTKMVVLAGFFPLTTPSTPSFSDVPPSNPFYPYIETAYAQHIISGYPDGTFRPNQTIRRDEMAGIVYNGIINPNWGLAAKGVHHHK